MSYHLPQLLQITRARWGLLFVLMALLAGAVPCHSASSDTGETSHWAFQPLRRPAIPSVSNHSGLLNEVDYFIQAALESRGLHMAGPAEPLDWIRRVSFDLTGLPPEPSMLRDFLDNPSESARIRVFENLLGSPRYGERWAQHWLDVVRYADTHGFEVNTPRPNAWPYRDYVIEAFNDDRPYDQFIRDQLAGDAYGVDAATGFLVTAAALLPGQIGQDEESKRLARQDELSEIVTNIGEAFLGLSISCARCHDHKFDPVSAREFYSMQAFFSGVKFGERMVADPEAMAEWRRLRDRLRSVDREIANAGPTAAPARDSGDERPLPRAPVSTLVNHDRFEAVTTGRLRLVIESTMVDNRREPCIDELEVYTTDGINVALASAGATVTASGSNVSPNRHELRLIHDGIYGNSSSWMSDSKGRGWVEVRFDRDYTIHRVQWGRDRLGEFPDRLATQYHIEVADDSGTWVRVADSSDRQPLDESSVMGPPLPAGALTETGTRAVVDESVRLIRALGKNAGGRRAIFAGVFEEPETVRVLRRGDPEQPREEVGPAVPAVIGRLALDAATGDRNRRVALADWIASPENPLTARVMVNRIWQWHFGTGFVDTPNDFGIMGASPSHPELLDWLADEFIRSGWSIKHLHRLIVHSAAYRQSSAIHGAASAIDSDARYLWRFPSRRLEAEAIRDSILMVSGNLNLDTGGPGFDFFKSRGGLNGFPPVLDFGPDGLRRMVYAHKVRMEKDPVFGAFDCPDAGQSLPRRRQSTTPVQALNLLNSEFIATQARALAQKIERSISSDLQNQVRHLWWLAYGRDPLPGEWKPACDLARDHGLDDLCRVVFNTSEFLFIP